MTLEQTGHCKHGKFVLTEGCSQCIAERSESIEKYAGPTETPPAETADSGPFLVKIRYYSRSEDEAGDQEYTYYSEDPLKVGDVIRVPVRNHTAGAIVSMIDVPEAEIAEYSDLIKTIPSQTPERQEKAAEWEPAAAVPAEPEAVEEPPADPPAGAETEVTPAGSQHALLHQQGIAFEETEVPVNRALIHIDPESDPRVVALYQEALHLQELAEAREIITNDDLKPATEDLAAIAHLMKALTERKAEFVTPVRRYLGAFQDAFKTLFAPIEAADRITRDKMKTFRADQQRKIDEAAQLDADKLAVAQREAALHQGEITVDLTPVEAPPAVPQRVHTEIGTAGQRDNWKYEVVDFALLPNEYKMPDASLLNATAKRHHDQKEVPGVRFYNEPTTTMRTR